MDADLEAPRGGGPGARLELVDRQQEEARGSPGRRSTARACAAPREPSAPSAISFTAPTTSRPSPTTSGPSSSAACHAAASAPLSATWFRNGNAPGRGEPAVGGEGVEVGPHLVDAGEPDGETVGDGARTASSIWAGAGPRLDPSDELLGGIHQDAGGLAARVALEAAPGRVRRVPVDAGRPERRRVGPDRVAIDADQRHGMIGRRAVE